MRKTGLVGPIASAGLNALRPGFYIAYLLNIPWFGHREEVHDTEEILASDAALVVVPRGTTTAKQLQADPRFTSADKQLFGCDVAGQAFPLEVYLTRARLAHDICPGSVQDIK
jgi:hypothetical protein